MNQAVNEFHFIRCRLCFQIFGLESLLGSDTLWPVLLALTILPAIVQSIMLPFCPESPRYLLISLNQEEEARKGQFWASLQYANKMAALGINETESRITGEFLMTCELTPILQMRWPCDL